MSKQEVKTKDKDFIDAASEAGYDNLDKEKTVEVSGKEWDVVAVEHSKSGMDAVCLENPETGERIIVYRGTEMGGSYWSKGQR